MLAQSEAPKKEKEENIFKQAWHSVEDALHLRSDPPAEDVPPPVPPKDEKWLVKTVNKSPPKDQTPEDPSFWDKLFHKSQKSSAAAGNDDEAEAVSISVPADAALKHLGVEGDDAHLEEKKNYFKRMAERVKEKFDDDDSDSDSDDDDDDKAKKAEKKAAMTEQEKFAYEQRKKLAPKVDPKEMQKVHAAVYGVSAENQAKEVEADKKLFGSWWGCHPRKSRAARKLAKQKEAEAEQERILQEIAARQKAKFEAEAAAAAAAKAAEKKWWQFGKEYSPAQKAQQAKEKDEKERKSSSRKHQALAAAAAYEAMKKYNEKQERDGKEVSHGQMKAILAGMAMAEAVKLFENRDDDDDDDDGKDDTVAEAGSMALKLFELLK
ncbi:hypothetical protein BG015_003936 [Linnemannia schmuckeri]|uniref:Uncharacterized protein n=1 Tax=Linnemannia schmuckeri TaxID=64567 RepID=A0A9P5RHU8_9FUNG|nr:hypothetical protein BG015_003936 [Linnemannia schmuckeri]